MGQTGELKTNLTAFSYQTMDFSKKSNYTGVTINCQGNVAPSLSLKGEFGIATGFEAGNDLDIVVRGYGKHKYNNNLNQNIRLQAIGGEDYTSFQIRYSPISCEFDLGKNFNAYGNIHYKGQFNTGKKNEGKTWVNSVGCFVGTTYKVNENVSFSLEGERYNLQNFKDNNTKNWGVNAILNVRF